MKQLICFLISFLILLLFFSVSYAARCGDDASSPTHTFSFGGSGSVSFAGVFYGVNARNEAENYIRSQSAGGSYGNYDDGNVISQKLTCNIQDSNYHHIVYAAGAYASSPVMYALYTSLTDESVVCPSSDTDGDGLPDDCDLYPDDSSSSQFKVMVSMYDNSTGESVGRILLTDRGDYRSTGDIMDHQTDGIPNSGYSLVSDGNPNWSSNQKLCDGDFDDSFTGNDDMDDLIDHGNDLNSDPIANGDDLVSDLLDGPNDLDDGIPELPDDMGDFSDNTDLVPSGDYATSGDIRNLSSDQQFRTEWLNSQQHSRNESLKSKIDSAAEYLNEEEYARDQTAETNADSRHNAMKDNQDRLFQSLDTNQENRSSKIYGKLGDIASNAQSTNSNLGIISDSLGVSNGHLSDISGQISSLEIPTADEIGQAVGNQLDIPTADEIGQAVGNQLIDSSQTIDTTITDNIPDLDKTDTLTSVKTKYSDRYDSFITTLRGSDLFSLPFGIFTGPSGSGSSIQTVNIGKWGSSTDQSATIDYSDYDNVWDILRSVFLLLTSFSCFKILVLKKG